MKKKREAVVELIVQLVDSLSAEERQEVLDALLEKKEGFPISIFRSDLSGLEAIVFYLKEIKAKNIAEIAALLNRKKSTIYTTHQKAKQKKKQPLDVSGVSIIVPFHVFANRKFAILESLVAYLKDEHKLSFAKISALLNKKYSTVRTVYVRYKEKCK